MDTTIDVFLILVVIGAAGGLWCAILGILFDISPDGRLGLVEKIFVFSVAAFATLAGIFALVSVLLKKT